MGNYRTRGKKALSNLINGEAVYLLMGLKTKKKISCERIWEWNKKFNSKYCACLVGPGNKNIFKIARSRAWWWNYYSSFQFCCNYWGNIRMWCKTCYLWHRWVSKYVSYRSSKKNYKKDKSNTSSSHVGSRSRFNQNF